MNFHKIVQQSALRLRRGPIDRPMG